METNEDMFVCFNKNCDKMTFKNGIYSYKLNQENPIFYNDITDNLEIITFKNKNIKSINVFIAADFYYFKNNDLNFREIEFNNQKAYSINLNVPSNNKSFFQKIALYFEGIFYNWYFYLISYILIIIYLIFYKTKFELKIKYPIFIILFLGLFLRLSHITYIPLWNDELYTFCNVSDIASGLNFKNTFQDAGNPPLFYIISNIWLYFFSKSLFLIRLLPCLIGVFGIYSIYFILNKILNKNTALIGAFLFAINIFIIVESNEIRSYILSMSLVLWLGYYFYQLKNEFNNKNMFIYLLLSICLVNLHYYCLFFIVFNFILGSILFKNKIKFLIINVFSFLTFLPYFIITTLNKSLEADFNNWIEPVSFEVLKNHITFYFGNIIFFIVVIIFAIYIFKKLNKIQKDIFIYTNLSIVSVFFIALLISLIIKPILFERYFCIFLPFLIINTSIILSLDYRQKIKPLIIILIFLFSLNIPKYENFNLFSNINLLMKYVMKDIKNNSEYEKYIVIPDYIDYIKYFDIKLNDRIIVSNFGVREDIDLLNYYLSLIKNKENKKIILYLPEICINSKIKYSNNINIKRIETTIVPIYKIVLK